MKEENEEILEGVEEVELMEELTEDEEKGIEGGASPSASIIFTTKCPRVLSEPALTGSMCYVDLVLNSRKEM